MIAAFVAVALTPCAIVVGRRLGVVDAPGELKIHDRPIPVTGGAAIAVAVACGLAVVDRLEPWLVPALLLAVVVGAIDDRRSLAPALRLFVQALIGAALVAAGWTIAPLGELGPLALVAVTVATCNAVNVVDGQDGLAGGLAAVAAIGLASVSARAGLPNDVVLAGAGAAAGFLLWNAPPASVFLGDGGAYVLAIVLSVGVAEASALGWPGFLAGGACLGVFAYELISTVVRRVAGGGLAMRGDREHTYDRLARRLASRSGSTAAMLWLGVLASAIGWTVSEMEVALGGLLVAVIAGITALAERTLLGTSPHRRTA